LRTQAAKGKGKGDTAVVSAHAPMASSHATSFEVVASHICHSMYCVGHRVQEAQAQLGNTAGGSAHAGMEFYRPIEGFMGATTSLGRYTGVGSPQGQAMD